MSGSLYIPGANGQFSKSGGLPEFSVTAKASKAGPGGLGFDLTCNGNPELLCHMLYDAMGAYPEVAKVLLTTMVKFCQDKGIAMTDVIKHTYLRG